MVSCENHKDGFWHPFNVVDALTSAEEGEHLAGLHIDWAILGEKLGLDQAPQLMQSSDLLALQSSKKAALPFPQIV